MTHVPHRTSADAGSWITEPKWQFAIGTFVAACILAAGLVPTILVQAEKNARQDQINMQSRETVVAVVCGQWDFIRTLTPQIPENTTDPSSLERIRATNEQRQQARDVFVARMNAQRINVDVMKECPDVDEDSANGGR
jgi:hypothetical protein